MPCLSDFKISHNLTQLVLNLPHPFACLPAPHFLLPSSPIPRGCLVYASSRRVSLASDFNLIDSPWTWLKSTTTRPATTTATTTTTIHSRHSLCHSSARPLPPPLPSSLLASTSLGNCQNLLLSSSLSCLLALLLSLSLPLTRHSTLYTLFKRLVLKKKKRKKRKNQINVICACVMCAASAAISLPLFLCISFWHFYLLNLCDFKT